MNWSSYKIVHKAADFKLTCMFFMLLGPPPSPLTGRSGGSKGEGVRFREFSIDYGVI